MKENIKKSQELNNEIKEIKSNEEVFTMIDKLKENMLYDDSHPYFVTDSPFYLATTE